MRVVYYEIRIEKMVGLYEFSLPKNIKNILPVKPKIEAVIKFIIGSFIHNHPPRKADLSNVN